jgi:hypothetical protein
MRVLRWVGAAAAGLVAGVVAVIAAFAAQDAVSGYQGPIQARIGNTHGLDFVMNVAWLAGGPSLVAAGVACLAAALPGIRLPRLAASVGIGGAVGCLVSVLTWTTLVGDIQGPDPVLFAGQGAAALAAVAVAVIKPGRRRGG